MSDPFQYAESIEVAATPSDLYELVTAIERTGEWSPICRTCWWREGDGPRVGAWFHGRNEADGRTWETESEVVAAEPDREFAWKVAGRYVRWGFEIRPIDEATTLLTESWHFLPDGRAMFATRFGEDADAQIALRTRQARAGIPATLTAIKQITEGHGGAR